MKGLPCRWAGPQPSSSPPLTRRNIADLRILVAGGAAAGLATAFNAPIAGGVFVLEELVKRFDPRTTVATLVASASGFAAARLLMASQYEFRMKPLANPRLVESGWVLAIGVITGVFGVFYNEAVMCRAAPRRQQPLAERGPRRLTGVLVGLLVWFAPDLAGSGGNLTQNALLGHGALLAVTGVTRRSGSRWVSSPTPPPPPAGCSRPMLVLGSDAGLLVGLSPCT